MNPPVRWYDSQRFIALCQSTVVLALSWLSVSLATDDWAWKPLAIAVVGNTLVALKDWWSPNVTGPFAFMNKNNIK